MDDKLISTRELASRLALSVRTIRAWARAGRLPVLRLASNRLRFDWSEVRDVLRATRGTERKGGRHAE